MTRKVLARDRQGIEMRKTVSPIGILALVLGLIGPIAGHAEIISVPSAAPSSSAASPPTVLRGSPSATAIPAPICPGYTLSPGYGCIKPRGGDDTEGWPGYGYWPEYGLGYPIGGFVGFGHGPGRSHRFARPLGFRGFHGPPGFHRSTRLTGLGPGAEHVGGFGRR